MSFFILDIKLGNFATITYPEMYQQTEVSPISSAMLYQTDSKPTSMDYQSDNKSSAMLYQSDNKSSSMLYQTDSHLPVTSDFTYQQSVSPVSSVSSEFESPANSPSLTIPPFKSIYIPMVRPITPVSYPEEPVSLPRFTYNPDQYIVDATLRDTSIPASS